MCILNKIIIYKTNLKCFTKVYIKTMSGSKLSIFKIALVTCQNLCIYVD